MTYNCIHDHCHEIERKEGRCVALTCDLCHEPVRYISERGRFCTFHWQALVEVK